MPDVSGPFSLLPAVLAGLFGVGVLEIAYADDDKVCVVFFFLAILQILLHKLGVSNFKHETKK